MIHHAEFPVAAAVLGTLLQGIKFRHGDNCGDLFRWNSPLDKRLALDVVHADNLLREGTTNSLFQS